MDQAKETNKVLFVGSERICQQVAYVLAIENYEIVETLTNENYTQYQDYTIYVCEFKRKSKKLITKIWKSKKDIQYLNDICCQIDKEYVANRRRDRKELRKQLSGKARLWLWILNKLKTLYYFLKEYVKFYYIKKLKYNKMDSNEKFKLKYVRPSILFLYVLYAPINKNVNCSLIENSLYIDYEGSLRGCCSLDVPFGNLLHGGELNVIYNSIYARIIKLSSLNNSYCLCDLNGWCPYYTEINDKRPLNNLTVLNCLQSITIAFDRTCNLYCKSCRNERYKMCLIEREKVNLITNKLLQSGYLDTTQNLIVAGQGEVFYSPYYRQLIETKLQRDNIVVLSNGILFNEENWNWIKNKYKNISVCISVDAATKETYSKLRCGGNFDILIKNLNMLSKLKQEEKIKGFNLNFVVQRDNFQEMPDFIRLGKSLGVDFIEFQRMNNFGNLSKKELEEKCLIVNDEYLDYELWKVIQDSIFEDKIVNLNGFKRYIVASDIKYGKNKC